METNYDDICRNNHGGNPESEAANTGNTKKRDKFRRDLYAWWVEQGPRGAITERALHAFADLRYSTVTARVSEMKRSGLLFKVGVSPTEYSGKMAAVLVAQQFRHLYGEKPGTEEPGVGYCGARGR